MQNSIALRSTSIALLGTPQAGASGPLLVVKLIAALFTSLRLDLLGMTRGYHGRGLGDPAAGSISVGGTSPGGNGATVADRMPRSSH